MLDVLYQVVVTACLYAAAYRGLYVLLRDYPEVLKIVWDLDTRFYYFNNETDAESKHGILYTCASTLAFVVLLLNPVLRSIIYFSYSFVHIGELSTVVFNLLFLRLLRFVNPFALSWRNPPLMLVGQVLFTISHYNNTSSTWPLLFYLVDESFDVVRVIEELHNIHKSVLNKDTAMFAVLIEWISWWHARKSSVRAVRVTLLVIIFLMEFLRGALVIGAVPFYYYAAFRVLQLVGFFEMNKEE